MREMDAEREMGERRQGHRLLCFLEISLWILGVSLDGRAEVGVDMECT